MTDAPTWYLLAVGMMVVYAASSALRTIARTRRQRRVARQVTELGETAIGQVVAAEPLRRAAGAAGHPVEVTFQDHTGAERRFRDDSGLGGYLARVGATVTVRYHPDDPATARVEEIVGRFGPFPVHPAGRARGPSFLPAILALVGALVVLPASYLVDPDDVNFVYVVFPVFLLVGALVLIGATYHRVRTRRERGGPQAEAAGVVTEVWTELAGKQGSVHPFTVHFATQDGREIHTRYPVASSSFHPAVMQPVRVRYDTRHPHRFEVRELRFSATVLTAVPYVLGVVFFSVGLIGTLTALALR